LQVTIDEDLDDVLADINGILAADLWLFLNTR
jgi:hypothetical protein